MCKLWETVNGCDDICRGCRAGAGTRDERRHQRGGAGRRRGTRRYFWPRHRSASAVWPAARDRHPHQRSGDFGRGRGHGFGGLAPGGGNARGRLCAVRHGRDRQPSGQEPLHVWGSRPGADGGAHADWHLGCLSGPALAVAGELVCPPARRGGGVPRHPARQLQLVARRLSQWRPGGLHGAQKPVGFEWRGGPHAHRHPGPSPDLACGPTPDDGELEQTGAGLR